MKQVKNSLLVLIQASVMENRAGPVSWVHISKAGLSWARKEVIPLQKPNQLLSKVITTKRRRTRTRRTTTTTTMTTVVLGALLAWFFFPCRCFLTQLSNIFSYLKTREPHDPITKITSGCHDVWGAIMASAAGLWVQKHLEDKRLFLLDLAKVI